MDRKSTSSERWKEYAPKPWLIFKELIGATDETQKFVYVSDGGHFENLGIYELVRRRMRVINSL